MQLPPRKSLRHSGWGHDQSVAAETYRPERWREVEAAWQDPAPLTMRGMGRAYGDAALPVDGGHVVLTERLNKLISFDETTGVVRAECGVTIRELMKLFVPRGWMVPVVPGTQYVTLGGALSANIHGKNHWKAGEFAEHVVGFTLRLPSGERQQVTLQDDLFGLTAGGMGMTGLIEDVTLQLKPITSASLLTLTQRTYDLGTMIQLFRNHAPEVDYMVGWIDHFARGEQFGRGVFEAATHTGPEEGLALEKYVSRKARRSVPFRMPRWVLNRYTMHVYNLWKFRKAESEMTEDVVDFGTFFHPLDGLRDWYRLYGKRGFFQYQCVLPDDEAIAGTIEELLKKARTHGAFSYLAVIKYHRDGVGPMAFSKKGFSVALDMPNTKRSRAAIAALNAWVVERGGRVYLAKDALLDQATFHAMYPGAREWQARVAANDPQGKIRTRQYQRLLGDAHG